MSKPLERVRKPVIAAFGSAWSCPDAALRFDPELDHKVVFSVTQAEPDGDRANPGLNRVARFINLFRADARGSGRLEVVAVASGAAAQAMLADEAHRDRHCRSNPNALLLEALAGQGAQLYVCAQALAEGDYQPGMVHPRIAVALSAMTVVVDCQLRGFALLSY